MRLVVKYFPAISTIYLSKPAVLIVLAILQVELKNTLSFTVKGAPRDKVSCSKSFFEEILSSEDDYILAKFNR